MKAVFLMTLDAKKNCRFSCTFNTLLLKSCYAFVQKSKEINFTHVSTQICCHIFVSASGNPVVVSIVTLGSVFI